ncbi:MAG: hypothetical protein LBQ98_01605 [Nitrososphaerota archaeon]|nr:hypothetical protein [Nitrososphaerota archaeon]
MDAKNLLIQIAQPLINYPWPSPKKHPTPHPPPTLAWLLQDQTNSPNIPPF